MKSPKTLSQAVGRIALGYVFLHFHLTVNGLDLMPDWVCFWMVLLALPVLGGTERSALLLKPLAIGLGIWELLSWISPLFPEWMGYFSESVSLIARVTGLYFHFQLLTNLAGIALRQGYPNTKRLLSLRTGRTVIATIFSLPIGFVENPYVTVGLLLLQFIIMIWTVAVLFQLYKYLRVKEEASQPE